MLVFDLPSSQYSSKKYCDKGFEAVSPIVNWLSSIPLNLVFLRQWLSTDYKCTKRVIKSSNLGLIIMSFSINRINLVDKINCCVKLL